MLVRALTSQGGGTVNPTLVGNLYGSINANGSVTVNIDTSKTYVLTVWACALSKSNLNRTSAFSIIQGQMTEFFPCVAQSITFSISSGVLTMSSNSSLDYAYTLFQLD